MKTKYEIEHIFSITLSTEELKNSICKKIARLIILEEK